MVALLVFIIATLEIVFGRKKLLEAKGLFGDNVIKNPARYRSNIVGGERYFLRLKLMYYFSMPNLGL